MALQARTSALLRIAFRLASAKATHRKHRICAAGRTLHRQEHHRRPAQASTACTSLLQLLTTLPGTHCSAKRNGLRPQLLRIALLLASQGNAPQASQMHSSKCSPQARASSWVLSQLHLAFAKHLVLTLSTARHAKHLALGAFVLVAFSLAAPNFVPAGTRYIPFVRVTTCHSQTARLHLYEPRVAMHVPWMVVCSASCGPNLLEPQG